jgi:hypothetical protein
LFFKFLIKVIPNINPWLLITTSILQGKITPNWLTRLMLQKRRFVKQKFHERQKASDEIQFYSTPIGNQVFFVKYLTFWLNNLTCEGFKCTFVCIGET